MIDLKKAHKHCTHNRDEIDKSDLCGCFYCKQTFRPTEIKEWCDQKRGCGTAICPHCGIDSVIGSASGIDLTEEFLQAMYDRWFKV